MANISLKDIQFPGLNNVYKVPEVDSTLTQSGAAADAKKTGDEITDLKQDLEGLDVYTLGLYPQMSVADTAVASFTDGADDIPVKSLTVDITPVQSGSGDPSPTNVRPISGWTGANVFRSSKNLFDVHDKHTDSSLISYSYYLRLKPNTQYTCSSNCPQGSPANLYFGGGSTDNNGVYDGQPRTMTSDANGYITMYVRHHVQAGSGNIINLYQALLDGTYWVQVEEGSTATEYEPVTRYNVSFPTEAGTVYGGTLDVTNGVLTVDHFLWQRNTSAMDNTNTQYPGWKNSGVTEIFGSGLDKKVSNQMLNIGTEFNINTIPGGGDVLWLNVNTYGKNQNEWKALAIDVQIYLSLATPVTYQLTPTEVATILGQNNIFADTGNINELTYRADLKAYIDEKLA